MRSSLLRIATALGAVLLPAAAFAQANAATTMDDNWHFKLAPYIWGSSMKGTVGVNRIVEVPVDVSFGDAVSQLDFAFLGFVEGRKNRLGFATDLAYMNLGADVTGPVNGQLGLGADVRSFTLEGILTYRVVNDDSKGGFVDVLGGARYMSNRAGLAVKRDGDEIAGTKKTLDWVDALAGARFRLPLARKVRFDGRVDFAGLGSDFTWNALGCLDVPLGKSWTVAAGYRYMDLDYDKGRGLDRRIWKVTYKGPYLTFAKSW